MQTEKDRILRERAREMRKQMTPYEKQLWFLFLRDYRPSFKRQFVIAPYILDFFCRRTRLAIELDGGQHYTEEQKRYDEARTRYLSEQGIEVLRFSNREVHEELEGIKILIDLRVKARIKQLQARQEKDTRQS